MLGVKRMLTNFLVNLLNNGFDSCSLLALMVALTFFTFKILTGQGLLLFQVSQADNLDQRKTLDSHLLSRINISMGQ